MQIARIQKMSFFDVAKPMDRSQQTLFSLDIDGVTVFSKSIFGYPSLKAVQNTVGAFKTQSKDSIIAWIDPSSSSEDANVRVLSAAQRYTAALLLFNDDYHFKRKLTKVASLEDIENYKNENIDEDMDELVELLHTEAKVI